MAAQKSNRRQRPIYQRKKGQKGNKSLRGCPELYGQRKQQFNLTLTPVAIACVGAVAEAIGESRSQVIEKALRGEIDLTSLVAEHLCSLENTQGEIEQTIESKYLSDGGLSSCA